MNRTPANRQPAGSPIGGRFAGVARTEPACSLGPSLPGAVSADDVDLYENRHAEHLAWALHEATGWPYVAVVDEHDPTTGTYGWLHLAVQGPGGQVLDVHGARAVDTVLDAYGDASDTGETWLVTADSLAPFTVTPQTDMTAAERSRAREVAAAVIAGGLAGEPWG